MAKSKKVVSKKVVAAAEVPAEVAPAPMPVAADAATATEAPAPAPVPAPSKPVPARKEKAERPVEDPAVKWKRRLGRWQAKAAAAGVDAKALMAEALAA
jgi:hypothetical protein